MQKIGEVQKNLGNYDESYDFELNSIKSRQTDECKRRELMLKMQGDEFDTYRKEYNELINNVFHRSVGNTMLKIHQIKRILMEEFPIEATDEKAELVANRLYDQMVCEDKDV